MLLLLLLVRCEQLDSFCMWTTSSSSMMKEVLVHRKERRRMMMMMMPCQSQSSSSHAANSNLAVGSASHRCLQQYSSSTVSELHSVYCTAGLAATHSSVLPCSIKWLCCIQVLKCIIRFLFYTFVLAVFVLVFSDSVRRLNELNSTTHYACYNI